MNETKIEINKSNDESKKSNIIQEQFRSTKRWNDLLEAFCMNMPLKRHWRNFRTYSDCFTASEAIEWLYKHLKTNQNFSHLSISRQNAIKVLQIFLKDKIIEDVRSSGENVTFKEFQDDDRVYKFNATNQYYLNRTTATMSSVTSLTTTLSIELSTSDSAKILQNEISIENKENIDTKNSQTQVIKTKKSNLNVTKSISSSNDVNSILKKYDKTNDLMVRNENRVASKMDITVSIPFSSTTLDHQKGIDSKDNNKNNGKLNRINSAINTTSTTSTSVISYTNNSHMIIEIWSKTTRKMLESVIKKAVLNNNIFKISHSRVNENSNIVKLSSENGRNKLDIIKYHRISPPSTSTLKRSTDIKLNLSKLLDKKACDILSNTSGSYIKHNCTHINKHGVVINTESDLPSWLVKAMTTLLLWDNDTGINDQFPKFKDVFNEVTNYFTELKEPLLTKNLSHLFIQILDLLIIPTSSGNNQKEKKEKLSKSNEQQMIEEYDEIVRLFVTSVACMDENENISTATVEKLIDVLKDQMIKNHLELEELNLENKCMSYQLLDAILCISSDKTTSNYDLLEQVESNLINNAKLPFDTTTENVRNSDDQSKDEKLDEENEYLLQNLLLASLARLENCCDECLVTYNEINSLLNIKPNDYEEYLNNMYNVNMLAQRFDATSFMNATVTNNLQQEKLKTACLNEILMGNENEEENLNVISNSNNNNNTFFNAFVENEKMLDQKKLHRNNSFRAAIGDIQTGKKTKTIEPIILESTSNSYENEDYLFKMPTPKRLTRSVTNSMSSDHRYKFFDETITSSALSYNHILSSSISSTTLESFKSNPENSTFQFKLPFNPPPQSALKGLNKIPKSTSMDLNQTTVIESNFKSNKKRKCVGSGYNSIGPGISHSTTLNSGFKEQHSKLLFNNFKSTSRLNRPGLVDFIGNNRVTPSYSLTTLNKVNKHSDNFCSLKNLNQVDENNDENTDENNLNILSSLSLSEISMFIRSNMRASYNLNDKREPNISKNNQSDNSNESPKNEDKNCKITLATEIDSEIFYFIISAFRLCALMLPPTNKRKLHLLLRFLNKLKHNKHTAKYLLNQNNDSVNLFEDINFIDTSISTNQSLNLSSHNSKMLKINLNHDLENKSNAIESVIIKSFANSIVYFDKNEEGIAKIDSELKEQLIIKLVQILINNYTEIMRIPDDLISNIKYKINMIKLNADPIASSTVNSSVTNSELYSSASHSKLPTRYCSKISLQQYDKQKAELSKKHLTNLLNSILTDVNLKENEKLLRLKKFKDSHPQIYEEKYPTIKKALSILGINETIENNVSSATSSSIINSNKEDFESIKKKVFLSNFAVNLNQTTNLITNTKSFHKLFNKSKKKV